MEMELKKFRKYKIELVNGSKGSINIPVNSHMSNIIDTRKFIKDAYSETYIRSKSIVIFKDVGIIEL